MNALNFSTGTYGRSPQWKHKINLKCSYSFCFITFGCEVLTTTSHVTKQTFQNTKRKARSKGHSRNSSAGSFFSQQNWFRSDTLRGKDRTKYKLDKEKNISSRSGVKLYFYQTMQTPPVATWALASNKLTLAYKRPSYVTSAHAWCQSAMC